MKVQPVGTSKQSGSFGGMTAVMVGDQVYYRSKRAKLSKNAAMTYGQRQGQARCATLMAAYHELRPLLERTLLKTKPMQRIAGLFLQCNPGMPEALLQKEQADRGAALLMPYVVSRGDGSVPAIAAEQVGDWVRLGIRLGGLELGEQTTVHQLSQAIISENRDLNSDEALVFVRCTQQVPTGKGLPRFKMEMRPFILHSLNDYLGRLPLRDVLPLEWLCSLPGETGNHLAMKAEDHTLVAAIHSRMMKDGRVISSEQRLVGRNPYLATLATEAELDEAVRSFGRVKPESNYRPSAPLPPQGGRTLAEFFAQRQ